jgi:hypothetical protein
MRLYHNPAERAVSPAAATDTAWVSALMTILADRGIVITAADDRLKIDAPVGALTADLRQALVANKPALLAWLNRANARSEPEAAPTIHRIPLDDLRGYLAQHKLRVVGGTASPDGRRFRPMLYLADAEDAS